ncbi:MAG: transcription antitermination factor NusB [Lachnospirales bacterium]
MSRRTARKHIFNLIFQTEFNKEITLKEMLDTYVLEYKDYGENDADFIKEEYKGVVNNIEDIDNVIDKSSRGWSVNRISKVDLAILRLAVYEIIYSDVPDKVAVNEAVELAKEFSEDKSPVFINGILGNVIKNKDCK